MSRPILNTRILVIDDDEGIRDSFLNILAPPPPSSLANKKQAAAREFFGDSMRPAHQPNLPPATGLRFKLDLAASGEEGFECVREALTQQRPFAAIFCDLRMPGWGGLKAIEEIRKIDPRAEIVFVTAYSDHSIETITHRAGANVGYFIKPFRSDEVRQFATKLVTDWNRAREIEELIQTITLLSDRPEGIQRLLGHVLKQLTLWLETESAALIKLDDAGQIASIIGVGEFADETRVRKAYIQNTSIDKKLADVSDESSMVLFPVETFGVAMALSSDVRITPDRIAMLKAFLQHAALSIQNIQMQRQILQTERLASVGRAVGHIIHDIRGPIGVADMLVQLLKAPPGSEEARMARQLGESEALLERVSQRLQVVFGMLNDVLRFCKGDSTLVTELLNLSHLSHEFDAWVLFFEQRGVRLDVHIPPGTMARVDPARFSRVLWNLAKNAADAFGGQIDARVIISARRDDDRLEIEVRDNGPGLPEALRAELFSGKLNDNDTTGQGFGLAIVRQIIEAHDGHISLDQGEGWTRFKISLPAAS